MNILFIGSLYSKNFREELKSEGLPYSSAGQTFQKALIYGLDKFSKVQLISEYFIPNYPQYKDFFIRSEIFNHGKTVTNDECISYMNFPILKKITQIYSYVGKIKRLSKHADVIVVYEVTSRQLLSAVLASQNKKLVVIVPDLPEFMSENKNPIYLFAKKIDRLLINFALKKFHGFVLFSPYMQNKLDIGNRPKMVLEGIYHPLDYKNDLDKLPHKILLYTGKIEKWFGLEDLFKAFSIVKGEDYRLWLCGSGDIDMIKKYMQRDNRIVYKGSVSHEDALVYQKQATLLVNPRHSSDEFTLYSFPSKTMEYMASGTPTLMSPLKSLPDDYKKYLYLFKDESITGMASKIKECLDKSPQELYNFGKMASEFICNHKSSYAQAHRLVEFLKYL